MGKKQHDLQDGTPYGPYKWMQIPNVIPMCNYVFPQTVSVFNTWGSYGMGKRPGSRSEVADRIAWYSRSLFNFFDVHFSR